MANSVSIRLNTLTDLVRVSFSAPRGPLQLVVEAYFCQAVFQVSLNFLGIIK